MDDKQTAMQRLRSLPKAQGGNFAIMTALALPVLLGIGGAALELARAMQIKKDLQTVADSAVLSATTKARLALGKMTDAEMMAAAKQYIASSSFAQDVPPEEKELFETGLGGSVSRNKTDKGEEFIVRSDISYVMKLNPLLSFIGHDHLNIAVSSTAKSSFNNGTPISLFMMLDRSGSMAENSGTAGVTRMASLKIAVKYLVETLQKSDPSYSASATPASQLVRTGAVAYNENAFKEEKLKWGTSATLQYVNNMPDKPSGLTSAIDAMKIATNALKQTNTTESTAHQDAGNASFQRYLVFMTDGEMTGSNGYWNSSIDNSVRQLCTTAKADGIILFSVAFKAPVRGKSLLEACASSTSHYYAPEKMEELVAAFGDIARKASSAIATVTN
jgi:hypothetical protein